jgi:hypothetical protein
MSNYREEVVNNDDGRLVIQWVNELPFIHLQLYNWSVDGYKKYWAIWLDLLKDLAERGHPCVFVLIPDNDEKLYKFETMFGFVEASRVDNSILMVKDTE